ncbi:hypothetical protein CONLIGDRAFT_460483 [Coniochaeta ligniaria NRRL 30616]|uniref:Uncharacterized protein n=1 Tax=Coniochaeta ligniaria NRRL 30616 TaxID=1408157 RepID=A0A1J7ILA2_9PEZI|nr:hypothetical protein CONLIGDRAFT_460483 [Coniochaeta ligniaria NRRL 30616]
MSGVRNLRAMFEQKGDTSPPSADDRGRSPGAGSAGTESPRPISRIRTNFIAIEKDGRLGLQRDTSRDSSVSGVSTRKLSGDLETPSLSRTTSQENTSAPAENKAEKTPMRRTSLREQPIPESPRTDSVPQMPSLPLPKSPNGKVLAPPINPDKTVDEEEVNTKMAVGGPTDKSAVTGNGPIPPKGEILNASGSKSTGKTLAPVNTASKTLTKPTKSPTVTKPLKSPATAAPKLPTKTPEKKAAHPEKPSAPRASVSTTKPAPTSASGSLSAKKPPPLQPSPASTGFVKPKVKSPTRPVKLPPGLTTHTAASATKFNVPRQSLPAAGHRAESQARSHSRASISTTATRASAAAASKPLKRQSSTISRPRPSIGPPPKQHSKDHPPTKKEAHVDEGFLARMMRPTTASASKTHDKAPLTPPRKTAPAPVVKKAVHKPETKHPEIKHVKPVVKSVPAAASSSSHAEQSSSAKEVAPVVEKVATAEEAVEVAKQIDGPAALPEETKPEETEPEETEHEETEPEETKPEETKPEETEHEETKPEEKKEVPAVEEVAPVVEQLGGAAEETEAAKEAEDEVPLPTESESSKHEIPLEQDEAALEQEAAEEAPSEATLVNGSSDKTIAPELAEPIEEAVKAVRAEEEEKTAEEEEKTAEEEETVEDDKTVEESVTKEQVAA